MKHFACLHVQSIYVHAPSFQAYLGWRCTVHLEARRVTDPFHFQDEDVLSGEKINV